MVKIEKLFDGAKGTFTREGKQVSIIPNQLLTMPEYETLVVTEGRVLISINEEELKEISAQGQQLNLNIQETTQTPAEEVILDTKSPEDTGSMEPPSEAAPEASEVVEKPVIVKPAPRKK